jgi:predicted amidohydrolase YtcJ
MQNSTFFWTQIARCIAKLASSVNPTTTVGRSRHSLRTLGAVSFVFCAVGSALAQDPAPADLIITNARILTVNSSFTISSALAIGGDKILAVGRDRQMAPYKGPATRFVDGDGRVVLPGLYDGNVRSYQAALSEFEGPLPVLTSIAEAQDYIRDQVTNKPAGSWIVVERLYPTRLKEGRLPTLKELDEAATNNPVFWNSGMVSMVNSKAMQLCKITKDTYDPPGGRIVKDPRTRVPTGLLRDTAVLLVKVPVSTNSPTHQEQRQLLKHLYQLYNEQGITSIGERVAGNDAIDLFRELRDDKELTVRVNCTRGFLPAKTADDSIALLDTITNAAKGKLAYGPTGTGDEWVRIGALTTVMDGDITTGTAYLRTPYGIGPTYQITEPAERGSLYQDPFILPAVYLEAARRGWQLSAHCVGDAAMDALLNAYQTINFQTNITQRRALIIDSDFQAAQNWARCQHLKVGAEMDPIVLYKDGYSLTQTIGQDRMKLFMPLKTWFDSGIVVGAGSGHIAKLDSHASMNPWNPWLGMWITLTRQTEKGIVINEDEILNREQAVRLFTINNAMINFEERTKGSIEPGKYADIIMVDRDILKCPVDDIRDTKVLWTIVGGKVVWQAHSEQLVSESQFGEAQAQK